VGVQQTKQYGKAATVQSSRIPERPHFPQHVDVLRKPAFSRSRAPPLLIGLNDSSRSRTGPGRCEAVLSGMVSTLPPDILGSKSVFAEFRSTAVVVGRCWSGGEAASQGGSLDALCGPRGRIRSCDADVFGAQTFQRLN
jgi:hypothetical protein